VTARFSGPELSHDQIVASTISPPLLVPSSDQELNKEIPSPLRSEVPITNVASAFTFECPRSCQLQFALPSEELARSAAEQMKKTLTRPVRLVPGEVVQLFRVGEWKGWLETRPFEPVANRFTFFRHEGRLLAQSPGSNRIDSAVSTIPPGSQLVITGHYTINNRSAEEHQFSATLVSADDRPGIYWFTWYSFPNPQPVDDVSTERWELLIHDGATGRQLHRFQSSPALAGGWKRRGWWDAPVSLLANKRLAVTMFERFADTAVANQNSSGFFLEMVMQRQTGANAATSSESFRTEGGPPQGESLPVN
jgi:hypothetical protein